MRWQWFEDKIRTTLSGHRSEVDTEALWAAIEPRVDAINRDRRRRRPFLWFWLAGVLLAAGALWWLYPSETGAVTISSFPVPVAVAENEADPAGGSTTGGTRKAATAGVAAESTGRVAAAETEREASRSSEASESRSKTIAGRPETALAEVRNPTGLQKKETTEVTVENNSDVSSTKTEAEGSLPSQAMEGRSETIPVRPGAAGDDSEVENPATATDTSPVRPEATASPFVMPATDRLSALNALPGLPLSPLATPPLQRPGLREVMLTESPKATLPAPGRTKAFRFSVGVLGGVGAVDRKLEASDSMSLDLLERRQRTERSLEAAQAGLRLTVRHSSGLGLTTGLNYTRINERFRYETSESRVDSIYGVQYLAISLDNDTVPVHGVVPLEITTTNRQEYYNHYRLLEVPVLADYRYAGRRFSLGAQAGVFVNLSLRADGRLLAAEDEIQDFAEADIFRTRVGLSYHLGLSAGYFVTPRLELTVAPHLRHFPGRFTKSSYGVRQRYDLYGVEVGVVYYFDSAHFGSAHFDSAQ